MDEDIRKLKGLKFKGREIFNIENDAREVAQALDNEGFNVDDLMDPDTIPDAELGSYVKKRGHQDKILKIRSPGAAGAGEGTPTSPHTPPAPPAGFGSPPPAPSSLQELLCETLGDQAPKFILKGIFTKTSARVIGHGETKDDLGMQGHRVVLKAIRDGAEFEHEKAMFDELKGRNVAVALLVALQSDQTNTGFHVLVLEKGNCTVDE